ncbi:DinB family protein [Corynebacterium comes]|nr:DinB family protein [Corynebacterium comes]
MRMDRADIIDGYRRACMELDNLLAQAGDVELRSRSAGTRWTNEELLFHMVFGYMVVRRLLPLVKFFGHLPDPLNIAFARLLDAGIRPFDWVNYFGSRAAARVYNRHRMARKLRRLTTTLATSLEKESEDSLALRMVFPTRWDPFFTPVMTVADVYAYPTLHFDFHARQLSFPFDADG